MPVQSAERDAAIDQVIAVRQRVNVVVGQFVSDAAQDRDLRA